LRLSGCVLLGLRVFTRPVNGVGRGAGYGQIGKVSDFGTRFVWKKSLILPDEFLFVLLLSLYQTEMPIPGGGTGLRLTLKPERIHHRATEGTEAGSSGQPLEHSKLVDMDRISLTVDNQGRIMLPSWWRRENHVGPQTELCVFVTDGGALALETRSQGIARAQQLVRRYIPQGVSLVDELIQDRREEAAREWGK
jgi:bifunctional DNA-binding transcriptional regulator/antitoxin component of YhaV-PrlF toxin-antitoxin module